MSATTDTPTMKYPTDEEVGEWRVRLFEAAGRRTRLKDEAKQRWQEEVRAADQDLAAVVVEARERGVPWSAIADATDIRRQNLSLLVTHGRSWA